MFKSLFPSAWAPDVFAIDYAALFHKGYKGILFDVDNTLVHHNGDATPEVEALFHQLHAIGLKTVVVSNNDAPRLERFLQHIDCPYVCDANKPDAGGYQKAVDMLGISTEEAVFIGDQMFVDIYGANKAGMDSILVHYIVVNEKEPIGIRRHLEKVVLFFYNLRKSAHKLGDVIKG